MRRPMLDVVALRRQEMRRELKVDTAQKINALAIRQEQILRVFDRTIGLLEEGELPMGLLATG